MSDIMDGITYMDYSLNNSKLTDDISKYDNDIIMELFVLWQLQLCDTMSAPKTDKAQIFQWVAPILISCVCQVCLSPKTALSF